MKSFNNYNLWLSYCIGHPIHGGKDYIRGIAFLPEYNYFHKIPLNEKSLIELMKRNGFKYEGKYPKWNSYNYMFSKRRNNDDNC